MNGDESAKQPAKKQKTVEEVIYLGIAVLLFLGCVLFAKDGNMMSVPIGILATVAFNISYKYAIQRKYE